MCMCLCVCVRKKRSTKPLAWLRIITVLIIGSSWLCVDDIPLDCGVPQCLLFHQGNEERAVFAHFRCLSTPFDRVAVRIDIGSGMFVGDINLLRYAFAVWWESISRYQSWCGQLIPWTGSDFFLYFFMFCWFIAPRGARLLGRLFGLLSQPTVTTLKEDRALERWSRSSCSIGAKAAAVNGPTSFLSSLILL